MGGRVLLVIVAVFELVVALTAPTPWQPSSIAAPSGTSAFVPLTPARILDTLLPRNDASASMFALRGLLDEDKQDFKSAEAHYRKSLSMDEKQPGPLNNLAYVLLQHGGNLDEARSLSERAIALASQSADFYDTLARMAQVMPATVERWISFSHIICMMLSTVFATTLV